MTPHNEEQRRRSMARKEQYNREMLAFQGDELKALIVLAQLQGAPAEFIANYLALPPATRYEARDRFRHLCLNCMWSTGVRKHRGYYGEAPYTTRTGGAFNGP